MFVDVRRATGTIDVNAAEAPLTPGHMASWRSMASANVRTTNSQVNEAIIKRIKRLSDLRVRGFWLERGVDCRGVARVRTGAGASRVGGRTGNGSAPALSSLAPTIHGRTDVRRYGHLAMVANAAPTPDADAPLLVESALELGSRNPMLEPPARREERRHRE